MKVNFFRCSFKSPHFLTIHGFRDNTTRMLAQTVSAFSLSQHMVLDNSILLIFVLCIRLCKKLLGNSFSAGTDEGIGCCCVFVSTRDFMEVLKDYFLSLAKYKFSFPNAIKLTPFFSIIHTCLCKYFINSHPSCVVTENYPPRSRLPSLFSKGGIQLCRGTKQGLCTIQVLIVLFVLTFYTRINSTTKKQFLVVSECHSLLHFFCRTPVSIVYGR